MWPLIFEILPTLLIQEPRRVDWHLDGFELFGVRSLLNRMGIGFIVLRIVRLCEPLILKG